MNTLQLNGELRKGLTNYLNEGHKEFVQETFENPNLSYAENLAVGKLQGKIIDTLMGDSDDIMGYEADELLFGYNVSFKGISTEYLIKAAYIIQSDSVSEYKGFIRELQDKAAVAKDVKERILYYRLIFAAKGLATSTTRNISEFIELNKGKEREIC